MLVIFIFKFPWSTTVVLKPWSAKDEQVKKRRTSPLV